jgi:phosphohistidine phosphatase SixA
MLRLLAALLLSFLAGAASAEDRPLGAIARGADGAGEMRVVMPSTGSVPPDDVTERLRFEPWQMLGELFRNDIVLLMRHGPTDWTTRDAADVAPDDCAAQRRMSEDGKARMRELGTLLVANGIVPGRIVTSRWCRNQETLAALAAGMKRVRTDAMAGIEVETVDDLNLLLSLQGTPNVTAMRAMIRGWQGEAGGPLLLISHFTNIAELTEFSVYEGEILMLDPRREGRVLGYLRLASARPDIGHFDPSVVPKASVSQR